MAGDSSRADLAVEKLAGFYLNSREGVVLPKEFLGFNVSLHFFSHSRVISCASLVKLFERKAYRHLNPPVLSAVKGHNHFDPLGF